MQVERHDRDVPPEFKQVNPHGRVPALRDGDVRLYETAAIILHVGDRFPESPLAPPIGTPERSEMYRWLAYLTNTLHTAYSRWYAPWYLPDAPESAPSIREVGGRGIGACLHFSDGHLRSRRYLVGERFTGADLLLHMLASPNWSLDLEPAAFTRADVARHHALIDARPAVVRVKQIHGLEWPR